MFLLQGKDFAATYLETGPALPISVHIQTTEDSLKYLDLKVWRPKLHSFSFYFNKYKCTSWLVFIDTGPVEDIWID